MTLLDTKRGGLTFDPGPKLYRFHNPGHHKVRFALPVNIFNNGDFQIVASLRIDDPADPKKPKAIAFANGEDSCTFAIRDTRNGDYALLNNDILSIKCEGIVNQFFWRCSECCKDWNDANKAIYRYLIYCCPDEDRRKK